MKKQRLPAGAAVLAAAAFLAACGHQLVADPMAPVRAWIGGPPASVSVSKGTVTMIVRPKVANQGFKTQALVPPYVVEDVTRLHIELWRVPNPDGTPPDTQPESLEAGVDLSQAQILANSPVTFTSLAANKRYEVRSTAFGQDNGLEIQISDDSLSYTTVNVGTDTVVDVTIRVKLGDSDFVGSGSSSVVVVPGIYTPTGSPTITVETPTPAPPPTPTPAPAAPSMQASFTGIESLSDIADLTSVTGAVPGTYRMELEATDMGGGMYNYSVRWGENGNLGSPFAIGGSNIWPPPDTTLTGPGTSGTITVDWKGVAPTNTRYGDVLIVQP